MLYLLVYPWQRMTFIWFEIFWKICAEMIYTSPKVCQNEKINAFEWYLSLDCLHISIKRSNTNHQNCISLYCKIAEKIHAEKKCIEIIKQEIAQKTSKRNLDVPIIQISRLKQTSAVQDEFCYKITFTLKKKNTMTKMQNNTSNCVLLPRKRKVKSNQIRNQIKTRRKGTIIITV